MIELQSSGTYYVHPSTPDADRPGEWVARCVTNAQRAALLGLVDGPGYVNGNTATSLSGYHSGIVQAGGKVYTGYTFPKLVEKAGARGTRWLWRLTDAGRAVVAGVAP